MEETHVLFECYKAKSQESARVSLQANTTEWSHIDMSVLTEIQTCHHKLEEVGARVKTMSLLKCSINIGIKKDWLGVQNKLKYLLCICQRSIKSGYIMKHFLTFGNSLE